MGIETALIGGAAAIGSSIIGGSAASKAAKAQANALRNQRTIDIPDLLKTAEQADRDLLKRGEDYLKAERPGLVAGRTAAVERMAGVGKFDEGIDRMLKDLDTQIEQLAPARMELARTSAASAQADISAGGRLSADQQAELVRAGVVAAGGAAPVRGSTARIAAGKLLASESENLKNVRAQRASALFGLSEAAAGAASSALLTSVQAKTATDMGRVQRDTGMISFVDSSRPTFGLGGSDVANLEVANLNQQNATAMQIGQVQANAALARGQMLGGILGGLGSIPGAIQTYNLRQAQLDRLNIQNAKLAA